MIEILIVIALGTLTGAMLVSTKEKAPRLRNLDEWIAWWNGRETK